MKIAVVNDIHFGPERPFKGEIRKLSRYSDRELICFLEAVAGRPDIGTVVQLGDLIEREGYQQDAERYRQALSRFNQLPQPVRHVIGNHEQAYLGDEDLRTWLGCPRLFYSFSHESLTCLVLHSEHRVGIFPRIGISQLSWLEEALRKSRGPVVVFVHHPLADYSVVGNPWFENDEKECFIENRQEVRGLLEASGKVAAVINGHAHWHNLTIEHSIPYLTLQSLVEKVSEDTPAASWATLEFLTGELRLEIFGYQSRTLSIPLPAQLTDGA